MRRLRVDVILLGRQRLLLERILDKQSQSGRVRSQDTQLLEGLENMLSDTIDSLIRDGEVILKQSQRRMQ
ncbi:MAG: hypothetical protein UY62_C0012G0008 [Parcubacteria group bacterium GW2011_GWF2_50_9]|nr:MAG: hypothetical protein UY62_C0012G0008 [Parcubacteria group bacterium GW2011_GWF2_50_9]